MPAARRGPILLAAALAVALLVGTLAWLLVPPPPPEPASRAARLYARFCVECHGADGRGAWRATLFLIRPGDLTTLAGGGGDTDRYLFDIIKHGGAPIGRPGMPGYGFHLSDEEIGLLVRYLRALPPAAPGGRPPTGASRPTPG